MTAPRQVFAAGTLAVILGLKNTSDHSVDLYLRGRSMTFDLQILDARQKVILSRLGDTPIPAILHIKTLAPRQSLSRGIEWKLDPGVRLGPGAYMLRAELLLEGGSITSNIASIAVIERQ